MGKMAKEHTKNIKKIIVTGVEMYEQQNNFKVAYYY